MSWQSVARGRWVGSSVGLTLVAILFSSLACGSSGDSGSKGSEQTHSAPQGITQAFAYSCDGVIDCCGQCFEYYVDDPSDAFTEPFTEQSCGDYKSMCSLDGAVGLCVRPELGEERLEGVDTVIVFYEKNGDGEVYHTPESAETNCNAFSGTWEPL